MILDLMMQFWQWTVFGALVVVGFIFSKFDGQGEDHMKPLPIETRDKGFWKGILMWLMGVRQWEIASDFHFKLRGAEYVIPAGFQFDGASVPKFLAVWLSPVGVLLMGGLVHDYVYKYSCLKLKSGQHTDSMTQNQADKLFRDICIEVNGFKLLNYLAYWALAAAGFMAWNKHKKNGTHL
jgi:hypothetical protein